MPRRAALPDGTFHEKHINAGAPAGVPQNPTRKEQPQ
jgi:hypothetical protein